MKIWTLSEDSIFMRYEPQIFYFVTAPELNSTQC